MPEVRRPSDFSSSTVDSQSAQFTFKTPPDSRIQSVSSCLGYSENGTAGTLGLIKIAGDARHDSQSDQAATVSNADRTARYKSLVRQLPSQKHMEALLQIFFSDIEWYYGIIDQTLFTEQLHTWNCIPYSTLNQGPLQLEPDIRAFPALLFQALAQVLLLLPSKSAPVFSDMKYASGMTFADLATEYSDAGSDIAALLGKDDATLVKAQAGLLRASFQKSTSSVVEAWHTIGATIRDAQEIGLHRTDTNDVAGSLRSLQEAEMRARLWLVLHLWDGHMGVVLGRPMSTRLKASSWTSFFADITSRRNLLRGEAAGPGEDLTPFSVILCGYEVAYKYLQDIQDAESFEGSAADKHRHLERIHGAIADSMRNLPEWARANSDHEYNASFLRSCPWLPAARETLFTEVHFVLLALHRPFIFSRLSSRDKAHKAALQILASQNRMFGMAEPREYMPFNFVFATFDAMVLLATIYILFPYEKQDQLDESMRSMEWGFARLEAMKASNKMARCAYDVVHALYGKMQERQRLTVQSGNKRGSDTVLTQQNENTTPDTVESLSSGEDLATLDSMDFPFSLADMPPLQPLHDLILQTSESSGEQMLTPWSTDSGNSESLPCDDLWRLMDSIP